MTIPAGRASYAIQRVADFGSDLPGPVRWERFPPIRIDRYLWLANGYEPRVEARLCWSASFLYVRFRVGEEDPTVRYTKFQDPVYKDSCVEFFVDMFPAKKLGYVNFEMNSAGTLLAAFGLDRSHRQPLWPEDLAGMGVVTAREQWAGVGPAWSVEYKLPLGLFRKLYGEEIRPGHRAAANFYKCGDDTPVPHYGAWSPVDTPKPDFHRPEFFGELIFA
jgi:hypothetical protein